MQQLHIELFSSTFCGACMQTQAVIDRALEYLPDATSSTHDVAVDPEYAELNVIDATPTVVIRHADGSEAFRSHGVPTVPQLLNAAVGVMDGSTTSASHSASE